MDNASDTLAAVALAILTEANFASASPITIAEAYRRAALTITLPIAA